MALNFDEFFVKEKGNIFLHMKNGHIKPMVQNICDLEFFFQKLEFWINLESRKSKD